MSAFASLVAGVQTHLAVVLAAEEGEPTFESHHPWWPELKEITWGTAAIVIVFGLIWWKGGPAIRKALAARTERIESEIVAAEQARATAEAELAEIKARLGDADAESARIVAQARVDADAMVVDLRSRLEDEIVAMRAQTAADLDVARERAAADVQLEIGRLTRAAAERAVRDHLDESTQLELVEQFITSVGATGRA